MGRGPSKIRQAIVNHFKSIFQDQRAVNIEGLILVQVLQSLPKILT